MNTSLKLALLLATAGVCSLACALESPLPTASWVPKQTRSQAQSAEYLTALPTARTFLDSLKADDCRTWRQKLEAAVGSAPENPLLAARLLKASLIELGFEPENIISSDNVRKSDPVIRRSVCVRHGIPSPQASDPLLVFSTLQTGQAANTAAIFALARNLQRFRLDTVRPVWFCAGSNESGLAELLSATQPAGRTHHRFSALLRIEGNSPQVFGNFMGERVFDIQLSSRGLTWDTTDSQANAGATLHAVRDALFALSQDVHSPKTAPYTQITISEVSCSRTLLAHVKPHCLLSVRVKSRDEAAMDLTSERIFERASQVLSERNQQNSASFQLRRRPVGKTAPGVASSSLGTVLSAWRTAHGKHLPEDAFLSTAFISSDALSACVREIPSLVMSTIEPYARDRQRQRNLFEVLARTILVLCGAKIDAALVPPADGVNLDFSSDGDKFEPEPIGMPQMQFDPQIAPRQTEGQLE